MGEVDWTFTPTPPPPSPSKKKSAKKKGASSGAALTPAGGKSGRISTKSPTERTKVLAELQKLKTKYKAKAKKK